MPAETFPNAPIREALIDIHVALPPETTVEVLAGFHEPIKEQFPTRRERSMWLHEFRMEPDGESVAETGPKRIDGYLHVSDADGKIVQARRDGFTFNKLRPYSDWSAFSGEARELWERYMQLAKPANVTRLGLRYINRIEVPLPLGDFRDFCPLFPDLPPGVPQSLNEFFMRFSAPVPGTANTMSVITTTFEIPTPGETKLPLILDIEVFENFDLFAPDTDLIWQKLDRLRAAKNDIFFASVTEAAKDLFR
jgi:uncharacterized protein (TIGR04255 family)